MYVYVYLFIFFFLHYEQLWILNFYKIHSYNYYVEITLNVLKMYLQKKWLFHKKKYNL
jgi:hypothetical protein